jgi:Patatin-like phospholipase
LPSTCSVKDPVNKFPESTTEHVYFEMLGQIAAKQPVDVIVDVIAGTSAGGINGIALAKALAHDLDQAPLKQIWFNKISIRKLLSPWKLLKGEAVLNASFPRRRLERERRRPRPASDVAGLQGRAGLGGAEPEVLGIEAPGRQPPRSGRARARRSP